MKALRLLGIALLSASGTASALNVNDPQRFVCKQGGCMNGPGIAWDAFLSVALQGNFRDGHTIPGEVYTVTIPTAPGKIFKQIYGTDGLLVEGDLPRTLGRLGTAVPYFSGKYGRITHAFLRQDVAVIKRGVYYTGLDIEYRGRFEYLPAKSGMQSGLASGFYIFFGDKVDTEDNETESGLFVSDENMGGAPIRFVKATPSYLAQMQRKYQQDMVIAKGEFVQQDSEKSWRRALAVIGKVGMALSTGGFSGGGDKGGLGSEFAMNLVSGMLKQGGEGVNMKEMAMQAVGAIVVGDKQLGSALGKAVSESMDE